MSIIDESRDSRRSINKEESQRQWTAVFHWKPFGFLHKVTINFKES